MRKSLFVVLILAVVMAFGTAIAYAAEETVKGELMDVACYAKQGDKALGAGHADCLTKCAAKGGALGILSGGAVYEIAPNAVTGENNAKIVKMGHKTVEAKGTVEEKDGKKVITLATIKLAKPEKKVEKKS